MLILKYAAICLLFPSLFGVMLDRYVLSRTEKGKLYDLLMAFWLILENEKLSDLYIKCVRAYIRSVERIFGTRVLSKRFVATSLLTSMSLTITAICIGKLITGRGFTFENLAVNRAALYVGMILLNYVYDFFTIFLTTLLLKHLLKSHVLLHLPIIFIDVLIAAILSYLVMASILSSRVAVGLDSYPADGMVSHFFMIPVYILSMLPDIEHKYLIVSLTTFVPTALYLMIIIQLYTLKFIIKFLRRVVYNLLDNHRADDVPVFTAAGAFFGLSASLISILIKLIELAP
jgi:hypothetical protein